MESHPLQREKGSNRLNLTLQSLRLSWGAPPVDDEFATWHSNPLSCLLASPRQYRWWQLIPNSGPWSP